VYFVFFSKNSTKYSHVYFVEVKMKKLITALLITLALSAIFAFGAKADEIEKPTVNAHGAILMDAKTGRILWGKNEHTPLPMASTTKIMTAILALESGRMDETVTASKRAAAAPKVKMNLSTGEQVRLSNLMLALMLESSNDAAVAIAEHLGGTVEEFCRQMTEKAHSLGAVNTIFETASGLDAGNHSSTPYDLAIITRYALDVPGFLELTNTMDANFSSDRHSYSFHNKNRLLSEFPGANGVKTGFTGKAGHCFVGAAKQDGMQLISVVLASGWGTEGRNQKWVDTKEILNFGFATFEFATLVKEDDLAGTMPVTRTRSGDIAFVYNTSISVPISKEETFSVEVVSPVSMPAPISRGDIVGTAKIYIGEEFYAEIPLVALESAARHDFKTSLEKVLNSYFSLITKEEPNIILPEFFAFPELLPPT